MKSTPKILAAFLRVITIVVFTLVICLKAFPQITVTNSVFPALGDNLAYVYGNQAGAINQIFTPPGGNQVWDLSNLQSTQTWNQIMQNPVSGTANASFPGASVLYNPLNSASQVYLRVTGNQVLDMGYYGLDPLGLGLNLLFLKLPNLEESWAPVNFFDIHQSASNTLTAFDAPLAPPILLNLVPTADSFRIRITNSQISTIDAWGTLTIPGGTFNVLRKKQDQYRVTAMDVKVAPLGWIDISTIGGQQILPLGTDTIRTIHFLNDLSKEVIAICTLNTDQNNVISVQYKAPVCTAPVVNAPTVTQPTCATPTGTIVVNATGGSTLEYSVNNGTSWQASATFSGLAPGNYNIKARIQSNSTCSTAYANNPVVLNAATGCCVPPTVNAPTVTQPTCATPTGTIVVNATGGALEYSVDNGANWQASAAFSGLAPGSYNIIVRIQSNPTCSTAYANNPVVLNAATGCCVPPTVNAPTVTQPSCATPTGTIVVNATGGGTLAYSVDNGTTWQTNATFSGLAPGSYNIKVRFQATPACEATYAGNPVVLNAATGCCVPPTLNCPANIEVSNANGQCGANVTYPTVTATGTPAPVITYSKASGTFFDVGTTIITATATNSCATASCTFTVTVTDVQNPVISVTDILSCFEAGNFGCSIDLGASATDNCGILSLTRNGPACFPVGTTTVTWTATDINGNTSTANQTVTRNPEINITLCAGPTDRIYKGTFKGNGPFGPTSVTLSSSVNGGTPGYTYNWSPGGATTSNITVSPAVTTTYTLTVTDNKGCTRSISKTIGVLPLSAAVCSGNGNNVKFRICHISPDFPPNQENLCLASNVLLAHLTGQSNGHMYCYLGSCHNLCVSTTPAATTPVAVPVTEFVTPDYSLKIKASPNPSGTYFTVQIQCEDKQTPATLRVINSNGTLEETFRNVTIGSVLKFGDGYKSGNYFVEVLQGDRRKTLKLVKSN